MWRRARGHCCYQAQSRDGQCGGEGTDLEWSGVGRMTWRVSLTYGIDEKATDKSPEMVLKRAEMAGRVQRQAQKVSCGEPTK